MGEQLAPRVIDTQDLITKCWRRLIKEYLSTLNTQNRWVKEKSSIAPGGVVSMVDPGNLREHLPLGRIQPDGKVRVLLVVTGGKDYVRPITELCPLGI